MASCLCEFHLWSLQNQYTVPDDSIGFHCYHDKGEQVSHTELPSYHGERQQFDEGRDVTWTPRNKRPERLRDNIKEVEDLLSQFACVHTRWRSRQVLQVVLSNAIIVTFVLSGHCADVDRIYIDRSLLGKLSTDSICDAELTDQFFLASHSHINLVDFAYFTKRPALHEAVKRLDKISAWEPKISQLDIPGPRGRRLEKCFSMNTSQNMMLVWWSMGSGEAWPWSPVCSEREKANLCILSVHGPTIDVLAYTKTESDPVTAHFSQMQPHRIFTLEQQMKGHGEVTVKSYTYEVIRGQIQTASVVSMNMTSVVVCQARSPQEDKLVLGLSDASLVMYDDRSKITVLARAAVPPASIAWHPTGTLFVVANARADIQIFDRALSCIGVQLVSEEPAVEKCLKLSKYFRNCAQIWTMKWCPYSTHNSEPVHSFMDVLFLSLTRRGPLGLLQFNLGVRSQERLSSIEIVKEYVKHGQVDEAICLLSCMNWDTEGQACYSSLATIINHLLRMPLNADREAQLETTLATFYAPRPAISEATILEYRDPISQLARRFFQHLLRYVRFDKAYLLAMDIGSRDLFMDIHYVAAEKGEVALADVAKKKAQQIESEGLDSLESFDDSLCILRSDQTAVASQKQHWDYQLPNSQWKPWQQEYNSRGVDVSTRSGTRLDHATRPQFSDGCYPDLQDLRLHDNLISDYTAALMSPDSSDMPGTRDASDQVV